MGAKFKLKQGLQYFLPKKLGKKLLNTGFLDDKIICDFAFYLSVYRVWAYFCII